MNVSMPIMYVLKPQIGNRIVLGNGKTVARGLSPVQIPDSQKAIGITIFLAVRHSSSHRSSSRIQSRHLEQKRRRHENGRPRGGRAEYAEVPMGDATQTATVMAGKRGKVEHNLRWGRQGSVDDHLHRQGKIFQRA